ncbi:DUF6695 family protein [Mangrovimonas spongiae]|uniref:Uncharacterized protein n=1 Tax=Mangrovimonas spongiae TaxID=2494697 RepID=A0A3R9MH21_9FLAO|nr:DUF6695 family protein [Mangrovimonas spongiae]RSK41988.1 hypothetical protein EJA19_03660 [Mangrovimonas spongiae]
MKNNTGIILTLAYPETIVRHAKEWYSPFLKYLGIGNQTHVRAGHAALVLINKETGVLEYYDFGRYVTPDATGRVRAKDTDCELEKPLRAKLVDGNIVNLNDILNYLATHPEFTHGEGTLYASICKKVNYDKASEFIKIMQERQFIRYAAFIKKATNCARFVTDTLITSVTDDAVKKRLIKLKKFTPSTVGNVVAANTETYVYKVDEDGCVQVFNGSVRQINKMCFLDRLKTHRVSPIGTLQPKGQEYVNNNAQWLSGIGSGAWFELHESDVEHEYRFRRVSPNGTVDVDAIFIQQEEGFQYNEPYAFLYSSNCLYCHVKQRNTIYRFDKKS